MNVGWIREPYRGPASLTLSTFQIFGNGTVVDHNNLISFELNPGVQGGCAVKNGC